MPLISPHPDLSKFYVIAVVSNPVRYESRYALYQRFKDQIERTGVRMITVEIAFGDRKHEVTDPNTPWHLQLRTFDELWHKENMISLGLARLPGDWQYVAWMDADIIFLNSDIINETVQQLQHYMFVQMFQNALDMGPRNETLRVNDGFVWSYLSKKPYIKNYANWHPGFAWAARREALEATGGLIDIGILGAGDRHMATAMLGKVDDSYGNRKLSPGYLKVIHQWQDRCEKYIKRDIGYVDGTCLHMWHGRKQQRGYVERGGKS